MADRQETFYFHGSGKERVDIFLTACLPELSRSRIQGLIKDGFISVDGKAIKKNGQNLEPGSRVDVRIPPPAPTSLSPENIQLDIIFENADLMIINKPPGMVVHPSPGHDKGTLVHAVLGHVPDLEGIGGEERPGIVHRLDKGTSGLIAIAKNEQTHRWLQDQFRRRSVEKIYLALVDGRPPSSAGRVEASIGRNTTHRKLMAVVSNERGREAVTEYRTLESFTAHTLLEVHLLTGRTHQIRVHMAFINCPVSGDTVYGKKKPTIHLPRQFLHAYILKVRIPGEETPRTFEAPLPSDLAHILEQLRQ